MYEKTNWPERYDPRISPIYALNDIDVKAPPSLVWKLLVDTLNWSSYFPPENKIKILTGESELTLGAICSREVVGFPLTTTVTEFEPERRISWSTVLDADHFNTAYHGWVISPITGGCHVLTEETQQGSVFLEEIGRRNPGALYRYHQQWVEDLARAAEAISNNRSQFGAN